MRIPTPNETTRSQFLMPDVRRDARWAVVLAGGEGKRMRPLVNRWLGEHRPKQYCTFVGSRSMFQHTVDRVRSVVAEDHMVTIIGRGHRRFLSASGNGHLPGRVIEQPRDLGTAPGVLLPTTYVLAEDPEATLVFFPSDHFVYPEDRFCQHAQCASALAEYYHDQIILVAAVPARPETDYGWIGSQKMRVSGRARIARLGAMTVTGFREKPDENEALALFQQGYLWNTMVMAVRAKTLWGLALQRLPEMVYGFNALLMVLRGIREGRLSPAYETLALEQLYEDLMPADFSTDILQHVASRSIVLPMDGVDWCDWGRPQRVTETLARLGRRPWFLSEHPGEALELAPVAEAGHM